MERTDFQSPYPIYTVMEATSLSSSLSSLPFSRQHHKTRFLCPRRLTGSKVFASGGEPRQWDYTGRLVDESMIVSRKRVHEMKVIERNYEPPADWMEWEKQYYASYGEIICNLVRLLQCQLMSTRPSLAFWIVSLVMMSSIPASAFIIVLHLLQTANGVVSTFQLN